MRSFHLTRRLVKLKIPLLLRWLIFFPSCSQRVLVTDYLVGTVHQAKGLEFDTVLIADDFVKVPCLNGDYQRRTNFSIGKGTAVRGTHPDPKVGKQSVLPVLVLQSPCFSALSSATGCPSDY